MFTSVHRDSQTNSGICFSSLNCWSQILIEPAKLLKFKPPSDSLHSSIHEYEWRSLYQNRVQFRSWVKDPVTSMTPTPYSQWSNNFNALSMNPPPLRGGDGRGGFSPLILELNRFSSMNHYDFKSSLLFQVTTSKSITQSDCCLFSSHVCVLCCASKLANHLSWQI